MAVLLLVSGTQTSLFDRKFLHFEQIIGRKIEVNDANVYTQAKKNFKSKSKVPVVVNGTTHYTMPILYPTEFPGKVSNVLLNLDLKMT